MPSRLGIVVILAFWLAVMGRLGWQALRARLADDIPPAVLIDLSDEATHRIPAQWGCFVGSKRVGTLHTYMRSDKATENYEFKSTYTQLKFTVPQLTVSAPRLTLKTTVTRDGDLVSQAMTGDVAAQSPAWGNFSIMANIKTEGVVAGGVMTGQCVVKSDFESVNLNESLDPVPVPNGAVLHPLQPMNRLRGVRPGLRWTLREVNPLTDALALMLNKTMKKQGLPALLKGPAEKPTLVAVVRPDAVDLDTRFGVIRCWVIDYTTDNVTATTWVAVNDGRVLRQDAGGLGETLSFVRED